ncbi:MAG TPA: BMP family ABC transporter substrate-binding protein [Chryseolinea sp.]|nr:BMP family ABC transporter substrate-binding protein [Chryseolinea sp.]
MNKVFALTICVLLLVQVSCRKDTDTNGKNLTLGFIYVGGKDDYGYNQAHAEGAASLKKIPGVKLYEEENVPETIEVQKTMESMINLDGARLMFPVCFGYFDPHILAMAEKYPDVFFLHCGGLYDSTKHPKNIGSYFAYIDEAVHVSGIVAGYTTKTKKLGFVAAKPIPQVLRNINAYTLGARSVDPSITVTVIFTGDWFLPVKEAEAVNSLVDQGVDVITGHLNSPKVLIETAEKRGVYSTGYHTNQSVLAPKGFLTGAVWNWPKLYSKFLQDFSEGKDLSGLHRLGMKDSVVMVAPYGPAVSEDAKKRADDVKKALMSNEGYVIFKGPLTSNTGRMILKYGESLKQTDIILERMDYLVDGVIGTIPAQQAKLSK